MTDYSNPDSFWTQKEREFYKELNDEERITAAVLHIVYTCLGLLAAVLLCALLSGCTTTKYVPVTETHTEHHWHTDTVKERDSTHTERNTVIRELDSAAMARYGIQMQANQRAWLVLQREMENRLRELEHRTAQRDTIHDSIPVPYPVIKEVPAQLTWWQQARLHLANIVLWLLALVAVIYVGKKHLARLNR
jgi:hypothetical protein